MKALEMVNMSKVFPFRASKHLFESQDEQFKPKSSKKIRHFFDAIPEISHSQDVTPRKKVRLNFNVKFS